MPAAATALAIRAYRDQDRAAVVALWEACGLLRPWNDPHRDIARKLTAQADGFLVGTRPAAGGDRIVASVMVGYDGHRGWVNYLAVDPAERRRGHARQLMREAESWLLARGCPKLNLQVRRSNAEVLAFYVALGYAEDDVVSLGRRLIPDGPA